MAKTLQPLFEKLEKARFTGELHLCFEDGQPASATLIHRLAFAELSDHELVTVEEPSFELKP
jgi:hypothetical protein